MKIEGISVMRFPANLLSMAASTHSDNPYSMSCLYHSQKVTSKSFFLTYAFNFLSEPPPTPITHIITLQFEAKVNVIEVNRWQLSKWRQVTVQPQLDIYEYSTQEFTGWMERLYCNSLITLAYCTPVFRCIQSFIFLREIERCIIFRDFTWWQARSMVMQNNFIN